MKHKAFTLVEFIVIISIFAIMAAVALFNFNGFKSSIGLSNIAQDIALTIRQAQVFGWVSQTDNDPSGAIIFDGTNPVRYSEGVYFGTDANGNIDNKFTLYKKLSPTDSKSYSAGDIIVDTVRIAGPYKIAGFRTSLTKSGLKIDNLGKIPSGTRAPTNISLAFTRPRPETNIFEEQTQLLDNYIGIYVSEKDAPSETAKHVVIVSRNGEIDVQ